MLEKNTNICFTVYQQISQFKMLPTNYLFTNDIYLIYMYNQDLTLKDLQGLICHKTQPNQTKQI